MISALLILPSMALLSGEREKKFVKTPYVFFGFDRTVLLQVLRESKHKTFP